MKLITKYLKPYTRQFLLCIALLLVQALCNLALPGQMSDMVNTGVIAMNGAAGQQAYIWGVGGTMLLIALCGVAAAVLVGYLSAKIAAKISRRMRRDVFAKVESFSAAEFDKFSTASLITRTTNDIQQIQNFVSMAIRMIGYALFMGVGGLLLAVGTSASLSWTILLAIVLVIGLIGVVFALAVPRFTLLQKLVDKLNRLSQEMLSGMLVIRAFGNEEHEEQRFEKANREYADTNRFVQRIMSCMMPAMTLIMNAVTLVIVWAGASSIAASTLQIGDMMAFIQYAMQIIMSFLMISVAFVMVPRAMASARRVREVLDTEPTLRDSKEPVAPAAPRGELEFRNVSFRYAGAEENVLSGISFVARPGETTAFIGSTGAGKSTLVNLIPRFYDVTEGAVLLDGVDIRKLSQTALHEAIGYVPQSGVLFSGSIASNVRTGKRDADPGEIVDALETAQAKELVDNREDGIDAPISRGGSNVSGGQKQRLSIARALVKKPPVYIFDDSFSALDYATDARLRAALAENTAETTVLIVAQRVSTIRGADQIIVLDKGKIAGVGTHAELMDSCTEYREIAESQLTKEEIA